MLQNPDLEREVMVEEDMGTRFNTSQAKKQGWGIPWFLLAKQTVVFRLPSKTSQA